MRLYFLPMTKKTLLRWLPAIVIMAVIFGFSSVPSSEMTSFGFWDMFVRKSGHMLGYGLLALAYWYGLQFNRRRMWLALLLAMFYALTDEFHQSFVPGRHPSWVDVLGFDGGGAAIMLVLLSWRLAKKRSLLKSE
jgi:VanZ family protein